MALSHFASLLLCAALISTVFACVFKPTAKERFLSAIHYFVAFVVFSVLFAWVMFAVFH